jgi:hypothetical protein
MNTDPIPTTPVESSNIAALGYDHPSATLAVVFKARPTKTKGLKPETIFHYAPVPKPLAMRFMRAESKGAFFASFIRDVPAIGTLLFCDCGMWREFQDHKIGCVALIRAEQAFHGDIESK